MTTGSLFVTGGSILNGGLTAGSLLVTGGSLLQGSLTVTGATLLNSTLTVTGATLLNSTLTVTGATLLNSSLTVSGASILNQGATMGLLCVTGGTLLQGITTITDSTQSTGVGVGALIVVGGVSVGKNLNIGGNTYLTGDLYVNGTTVSINSTTVSIHDNILTLNAGPSGTLDAGVMIQRYQIDNNVGAGDIVDASEVVVFTGAVQTGTTTTSIIFPNSASSSSGTYDLHWIRLTSGPALDNVRQILSYDGPSRTATILSSPLAATPIAGNTFDLFNRNYVATFFDEPTNMYTFAYALMDSVGSNVTTTGYINILAESIFANGNVTISGSSTFNGGITAGSLNITGNSTLNGSVTAGSLNVTGGSNFQLGLTAGSLNVTGNSTLNGSVTAGSLNVTGGSILQGGITAGSLNVTGDSVLNGNVTAGALNVTGASILQGGITTGSLYVTGASLFNGQVDFTTGLTSANAYIVNSTLTNAVINSASIGSLAFSSGILTNATITNLNVTYATAGNMMIAGVMMNPSPADIFMEMSFAAANNINVPANVTGLTFANATARGFIAWVSVSLVATTSDYALFELKAIQNASIWRINSSFVGDNTGVVFSITSGGQVQYKSKNSAGFVSNTMKFRALTLTV